VLQEFDGGAQDAGALGLAERSWFRVTLLLLELLVGAA
jgi:hypothetical protein